MTPEQKAADGLSLIKESVLEYLAKHPEGVRSTTLRRDLGLENPTGQRKDYLFWGLSSLMQAEGSIEAKRINGERFKRLFLVRVATTQNQPQATA